MLAASTNTTLLERQPPEKVSGDELIEHLRLIASQHRVCYEIWPIWSTSGEVRTQKGFELLLCGCNDHAVREAGAFHSVRSCLNCAKTYCELRKIAEWVLLLKKQPLGYEIYPFDHTLHLAPPNRQNRSEIVINTAVFFQCNHKSSDYPCGSDSLKEVRGRLARLGIHEDLGMRRDS